MNLLRVTFVVARIAAPLYADEQDSELPKLVKPANDLSRQMNEFCVVMHAKNLGLAEFGEAYGEAYDLL